MTISWNVDELRKTVAAQMSEADLQDEVIDALAAERDALTTRAVAAEAEAAKWREMHDDRDNDLKHEYARANAAEADRDKAWRAYQAADGVAGARWDEMQKLLARAEDAEATALTVRETLAGVIDERDTALAEVSRLRDVLSDIAEDTDADNPNSYRSNDREGCLDWVHNKARRGQEAAGDAL